MKTFSSLLVVILFSNAVICQGIRKNYNEMTDLERNNLVNAFYSLHTGSDLVNDLAVFHGAYFNFDGTPNALEQDIHFNLPDEPEREIFFAWHRRMLFEMESAMKNINPYNSIPFWNSSVDQAINSPLWAQSFMGQFDAAWNLNRALGVDDMLPTPSEVTQVQALNVFNDYSDQLERGPVHHGAHHWVGGVMNATVSPRDPIFYLHHAWIDKLWKDWEDQGHTSSYMRTDMIRYNGTYVFNGSTIPLTNPNNIINSRSLGTFYGENQLAVLDNYTVNNTYRTPELYFYRYVIQAGNSFEVPSSRVARFESVTRVRLTPGFHAANGSNFTATIGDGSGGQRSTPAIVSNSLPFDDRGIPINWDAYRDGVTETKMDDINLRIYPNPFTDNLTIATNEHYDSWVVTIYDLTGRKLMERNYTNAASVKLDDLSILKSGNYMVRITIDGVNNSSSIIIKQ